jgi:S1-C subfamily serine protease
VGVLGITIQPLTSALAAVVDAHAGVIVSAVDPEGPAADVLKPTDVIETIDGVDVESIEHWRARIARLVAGDTVTLRVRAGGTTRELQITALAPAAPAAGTSSSRLGLELAGEPAVGARVMSVEPDTSADRASLRAGDIITAVGRETAPRPAQVLRAFASLPQDGSMIVAVTRRHEQHLAVISKNADRSRP